MLVASASVCNFIVYQPLLQAREIIFSLVARDFALCSETMEAQTKSAKHVYKLY